MIHAGDVRIERPASAVSRDRPDGPSAVPGTPEPLRIAEAGRLGRCRLGRLSPPPHDAGTRQR